jgi:phospholipase C
MKTRRQFFRRAAGLSGGAALAANLLEAIEKASAIDPQQGSSYQDAEHVVILMQENRSFDHCFGTLRGVRGFNDPRAVTLPDGKPVWLQTNAAGETYAPFRLNIKDSKATWIGSLPHSWRDQTDARNRGDHDKWLDSKVSGRKECAGMPLTMGYYTREDIPFYYALADAFTVCDQNFCSSLTGTTPNRLYFWSGTVRDEKEAKVRNSDVDYDLPVHWTTFPERLEDAGISWKIYQNELSAAGMEGEEDQWLGNFTDSPIEWFSQYHVKFSKGYRELIEKEVVSLPKEIEEIGKRAAAAPGDARLAALLRRKQHRLKVALEDRPVYTAENFEKLSRRERALHEKAFTTNVNDPSYHDLGTLRYRDGGVERELRIPKGDVLHQFREDVNKGSLPAVSWLVAPENFSDHPSAPWYGQWYLAEVLNILTHNPEVWKKTIFVLTYDENDGYFDHVPPFVAPEPGNRETGAVSAGIDAGAEYWSLADDSKRRSKAEARGGSIGLGYRVPMVVASPWSRGGFVCSQVFDHTSVLQFLEVFLSHRSGKTIREANISQWRRTVCGDMTGIFQLFQEGADKLPFAPKEAVLEGVHKAKFKELPSGFKQISSAAEWKPQQEQGVRPSCALPYESYVDAKLNVDQKSIGLVFEAKKAGSPFHVYTPGKKGTRAYAVASGHRVADSWALENGRYHLRACGPNGFLREFAGTANDPQIEVRCEYAATGDVELRIKNLHKDREIKVHVIDHAYGSGNLAGSAGPGKEAKLTLNLTRSFHWYDFSVKVEGASDFERRYAGRVETGKNGFSDPAMG